MEGPIELQNKVNLSVGAIIALMMITFVITSVYWNFMLVQKNVEVLEERVDKRYQRNNETNAELKAFLELEIENLHDEFRAEIDELRASDAAQKSELDLFKADYNNVVYGEPSY